MIEPRNGATNLMRRATPRLTHWFQIERPDGADPLRFTTHDQMIHLVYRPNGDPMPGLSVSANRRAAGLGEKSIEISGNFGTTIGVTYDDMHQGRFWGARVRHQVVAWDFDFGPPIMYNTWFVADISYDDRTWQMALTGITTKLRGKRGDVFSRLCQNELGVQNTLANSDILTTSACPVNISQYPKRVQAVPIIDSSTTHGQDPTKSIIYVKASSTTSGLANTVHQNGDYAIQYFKHGRVVFKSGILNGLQETVYAELDLGVTARAAGVRAFRFMRPLADLPAVGDTLDCYVGCDKNWKTCRDKFDALQGNVSTYPGTSGGFRGFPEIPGTDRATTYPPARGQ